MLSIPSLTRRKIVQIGLNSVLSLVAGPVVGAFARAHSGEIQGESNDIVETLFSSRLARIDTPSIFSDFCVTARTGRISLYYQIFWPIFLGENRRKRFWELVDFADNTNKPEFEGGDLLWHRVRALPGVAGAHALAAPGLESDRDDIRALIRDVHDNALDRNKEPHREVIEILWQVLLSSLIASPGSWARFDVGTDLLQEANKLFRIALEDSDDGKALFRTGLTAWQFLESYRHSNTAKRDKKQRDLIEQIRTEILSSDSANASWFRALSKIYGKRSTFRKMQPQMNELIMGWKSDPTDVATFFALARIEGSLHTRDLFEGKGVKSPYMNPARYKEAEKHGISILKNYGFSSNHWATLRKAADKMKINISGESFSLINDTSLKSTGTESTDDTELSTLVPFRQHHEEAVSALLFGQNAPPNFLSQDLQENWLQTARKLIEQKKKSYNFTSEKTVVDLVEDRISALEPIYRDDWEFLKDEAEILSVRKTSTSGARTRSFGLARLPSQVKSGDENMTRMPTPQRMIDSGLGAPDLETFIKFTGAEKIELSPAAQKLMENTRPVLDHLMTLGLVEIQEK